MTSLLESVLTSVRRFPGRSAIHDGRPVTYSQLLTLVRRAAAALPPATSAPALGAVLVNRDAPGYAAVLATLWSGRGYVPLNPRYPVRRNAAMLATSGAGTLVVDGSLGIDLIELTAGLPEQITVVVYGGAGEPAGAVRARHRVVRVDPESGEPARHDPVDPAGDVAYLLFTSGTTGAPSGVPVRQQSVLAYLAAVAGRHDLNPDDRTSQTFDLTFDLSVHDMFATWQAGACLYPLSARALMQPVAFIRRHQLTAWFSVPSAAARSSALGVLGAGTLPSLRWSIFCGEPLTAAVAAAWQSAAATAILDNLYGPTEATIAVTGFQPGPDVSAWLGDGNGVLPIGHAFPGQQATVHVAGAPAARGATGELWLAGSQVAAGYWNDPVRTASRFVTGPDARWFRTGDLVRADGSGLLHYHGRTDDQIKINGFRVELLEVDHVLRTACDRPDALAVPWPSASAVEHLVAVVARGGDRAPRQIIDACARSLPGYMVPRRVLVVDEIPRNPNGKLDRKAAAALLQEGGQT
ncbi:AMP-binding protein [Actinoplanes subtropicus]|uniref:AMP-binding protein n=1 Tax=Actinoplanes subtropicus TaxID=543632 RepID=UPI0009FEB789|nr:AMP-binding protein [Actinoplanes subtropicus]